LLDFINGNKIRPTSGAKAQDEWGIVDSQAMKVLTWALTFQNFLLLLNNNEIVARNSKLIQQQKEAFSSLSA
jgi:hypothetical protein